MIDGSTESNSTVVSVCKELSETFKKNHLQHKLWCFYTRASFKISIIGYCGTHRFISLQDINCTNITQSICTHTHLNCAWFCLHPSFFICLLAQMQRRHCPSAPAGRPVHRILRWRRVSSRSPRLSPGWCERDAVRHKTHQPSDHSEPHPLTR